MDKLKLLRAEMKKHKVQGFIVPSSDEFQGEYVPPSGKRLFWLTGFDGSAGTAVVLDKKAAFFTDGRYTLQAEKQLKDQPYAILNTAEKSTADWLKEEAKGVVGYDPWLHTPRQIRRLEALAKQSDFELKPVPNLVDAICKGRPAFPQALAAVHEERYAGKASLDKRRDVVSVLKEKKAAAVLLTAPDSICWLLNIRGSDVPRTPFLLSYALVMATGRVVLFAPPKKITKEVRKHLGAAVQVLPLEGKAIKAELAKLKAKRVMADPSMAANWFFDTMKQCGVKALEADDPCHCLRRVKTPWSLRACAARTSATGWRW